MIDETTADNLDDLYYYRENLRIAIARLEVLQSMRRRRLGLCKFAQIHRKLLSAA